MILCRKKYFREKKKLYANYTNGGKLYLRSATTTNGVPRLNTTGVPKPLIGSPRKNQISPVP